MPQGTCALAAILEEDAPRRDAPVVKQPHYLFVGVDPGFTGAIAFLEDIEGTESATVYNMPLLALKGSAKSRIDRDKVAALVSGYATGGPAVCRIAAVVEAVGAMGGKGRKEGTSSMFRFGQGQGEILGVLSGLGALVFEVSPAVWKTRAGLAHVGEREVCKRADALFPYQDVFGPRGGALHGRAEALFLAAYARLIVEGRRIDDR